MLLEVLLGGGDHLQGNELVTTLLETLDDVANEATLLILASFKTAVGYTHLDAIWLDSNETGR